MSTFMTFNANGHQFRIDDGKIVRVSEYEPGEPFIVELSAARCGTCDARPDLAFTGDTVTVRTPCPYPDGITSVITLKVPSGKIIVTDDLRPVYNWRDDEITDYNSALGQHQAIEAMAAQGCAYGPVGNSCPGLYCTGAGTYAIASLAYNQETDEAVVPEGWTELATVITDLWAYSIADFDDWKARGGEEATLDWGDTIMDIEPGSYEFTHHTGERNFDRDAEGTVIFAHVRLLEGPS